MQILSPGWIEEHAGLLAGLTLLSILLLALTVIATPWLIARLPSDYFSRPRQSAGERGMLRASVLLIRNLIGLLLMLLGVVLLVAPGPGLVSILLGLSLCEFPGKHTLLNRFAGNPRVYRSLNWLRAHQNQPPFDSP